MKIVHFLLAMMPIFLWSTTPYAMHPHQVQTEGDQLRQEIGQLEQQTQAEIAQLHNARQNLFTIACQAGAILACGLLLVKTQSVLSKYPAYTMLELEREGEEIIKIPFSIVRDYYGLLMGVWAEAGFTITTKEIPFSLKDCAQEWFTGTGTQLLYTIGMASGVYIYGGTRGRFREKSLRHKIIEKLDTLQNKLDTMHALQWPPSLQKLCLKKIIDNQQEYTCSGIRQQVMTREIHRMKQEDPEYVLPFVRSELNKLR